MSRNFLLITLFIIIFIIYCWKFKVFETKINTRKYIGKRNLKQLHETSDYFKATLHNRSKDNNSSLNHVVSEISINNESIRISSSEFPCKSEASNSTFDKSKCDTNLEVCNKNSSKLENEIDRTSNVVPTLSKELSHTSEVTTDSYVDFNQLTLNRNNTSRLYPTDSYSESKMFDLVNETSSPVISFKKETLMSNASNSVVTATGILELDTTTGIIDTVVTTKSQKRLNNFQDQFNNDNTSKESNLTKPGSIKNGFQTTAEKMAIMSRF